MSTMPPVPERSGGHLVLLNLYVLSIEHRAPCEQVSHSLKNDGAWQVLELTSLHRVVVMRRVCGHEVTEGKCGHQMMRKITG